ncbi:BZ3500_MvSof-1268-A1-R1_Chr2-3g05332 [Microbotryum saponariae]|uniref:Chloride channel protein n=1 Tax=Microbotryum saponariae TaxID=289078 RepID=A0A2X0LXH3_9BASI|nr:BZ3500_MvSof-1268-A1-R1_Chr2-3g05332 [Microbotryum saponariae]SDA01215.1 BZ3501_MvSof-1269-A2-R1_Chr2-2g05005 [Microbotryum saponariae]
MSGAYAYRPQHSVQDSLSSEPGNWPDTPGSSRPPSAQSTPDQTCKGSRVRFNLSPIPNGLRTSTDAATAAAAAAAGAGGSSPSSLYSRRSRIKGENHSSIDWSHEYAKERIRQQALQQVLGVRGIMTRIWDATIPWIVVVATGLATGLVASCLDILSAWLSDLRTGKCSDAWWLSEAACCTGLDPTDTCNSWRTWAQIAGGNEPGQRVVLKAVTQYSVYMVLAVAFAVVASFFVQVYAPYAFHTGIPEIKAILGGYILKGFLSPMVLLVKSLGLPLAVASGLQLGKEGPLVHVSCSIGDLMLRPFRKLRQNEAAAAAGVSVAFGAPLGGVLFSLEEISTFFPGSTLWQSFVCAVVAAITLQYIDPFNTGKLVLFQVTSSQVWRGFELIPWLGLGVFGGLWGAWLIRLNEEWERMRRASGLYKWPVSEVAVLALFTAIVSYLLIFMRIPNAELVVNLFQDCSGPDNYGLCDISNTPSLVFLLLVTAFSKTVLTAVTFGASLPAGIFMPSLTIGACVGRAVGLIMASIQRANAGTWLFSSCPPDGPCISPPVYAVIGAASALGGVTRMTISLVRTAVEKGSRMKPAELICRFGGLLLQVVILFELTGAIELVLQVMLAVMVAKFTGDFFSKDGIYETWIILRNYPFLNNKVEYRQDTITARDVMTQIKNIVYVSDEGWTIDQLESMLATEGYRGFPIVRTLRDRIVIGHITRLELISALEQIALEPTIKGTTKCYFLRKPNTEGRQVGPNAPFEEEGARKVRREGVEENEDEACWISLAAWVDEIPIMMNQDTPMEVVVQMFGRLGLRCVLLTKQGGLRGILTKMTDKLLRLGVAQDLHAHMHPFSDAPDRSATWKTAVTARARPTQNASEEAYQDARDLRRDVEEDDARKAAL